MLQLAGIVGARGRSIPAIRAVRALIGRSLVLLATALLLLTWQTAAQAEAEFLEPEKAFVFSAQMAAPDTLELHYKVAPGYYMYRERFGITISPIGATTLGEAVYPKGEVKYDPTFEKDMEVFHKDVMIRVPVGAGGQPFTLTLTGQGCADAGLCYPPMDSSVKLTPVAGGYALAGGASAPAAPAASSGGLSALVKAGDTGLADALGGLGWAKTAGVFLVLGLLLAFTPCVLPMIPILSSIVLGGATQARPSRGRGLALAATYVLGMSVVYTALGVAAGLSGAGLAAWLQTPWILTLFAILLTVLALAMFDVFTFQMPSGVQAKLSERSSRVPGGRYTGALVMGALSALIVGPCVAAPLAGALLYISQTGDVVLGGSALFAMAWGMGVPLLIVGASSGALLPKAGPWMDGVKRLFGMLLLATAWWMLIPVVPTWVQMTGWAFLAVVSAVMLRAFDALPAGAGAARMFGKGLGLLLALAAAAWLLGAASGGRDVLQPLSHLAAGASGPVGTAVTKGELQFTRVRNNAELDALLAQSTQPVMLDFYADWCVSCREMERFTFTDPGVAQRMSGMLLVQADVTANNADDRALLKRFRLFGPPGIMFFEPGGKELPDARVVGFQDAKRFTESLDKVLVR
ncbi:Thiol:disulfide interchange protein DsbD precursor [Achromobacter spanius]|uniref:protein-disulfide reductase DsbD n=1 Tax=Achromobacter spanius TaxID=217203 RepID=UPI000C2C4E1B|nr:protein-disulfide reductase DsbD [Achromobacter spanius]AUA55728.1 protein-disulfide reductase DsbD [Achromobacter spanius]CAB3698583.1 Thiol:disulfide interchange protein DsbD [Achromobacter spanius]SPT36820.1 Thiol:disulfide interchange protein DsbD precursor [Achromobacter denitrificans]VEE56766.1 Thiol:disulfide interchange protein DsbD precursor [Achromobacter spanius]